MSKNKKHCRTCTICKFSKNYNIFGGYSDWILICTNECNKHFGNQYSGVVDTNEIPFKEKCKCLCVDDELKRLADEDDARRELLKKLNKEPKNQETYGTSAQPFPDNTWLHCLQIGTILKDMY